jgi:hypothetical protein
MPTAGLKTSRDKVKTARRMPLRKLNPTAIDATSKGGIQHAFDSHF